MSVVPLRPSCQVTMALIAGCGAKGHAVGRPPDQAARRDPLGVDVEVGAAAVVGPGHDGATRAVREDAGEGLLAVGGADRHVDGRVVGPGGGGWERGRGEDGGEKRGGEQRH
jgi:hypothetical protein